jgi:hypothetical protein
MDMIRNLFLKIVFCFCFFNLADAQVTFQKTFGGGGGETGNCLKQTFDDGYIMVGFTQSFGTGTDDVYLIKTDGNGDTLWTKTYGGASYDKGFSVEQTTDSGYIISGMTNSFSTWEDVYLIRTDANGDTLWTKNYGGNIGGTGYGVKQTSDGGFIITGAAVSAGGIHDVLLMKTDAAGDTLWTRTWGGGGDDYGFAVQQTNDGGYIVSGNQSSGGVYLIKTDSSGDSLWTMAYILDGASHLTWGFSVEQTADTGYIITGATTSEAFLLKTDSNGVMQWSKLYGGTQQEFGFSGMQTADGGYILLGASQSFPVGSYHSVLIRTDASGDTLWTKTFIGGGTATGYTVRQSSDGGFVLLCNVSGFGAGDYDFYLVKTDANGNSGCQQGNTDASVTIPAAIASVPVAFISSGGTVNPAATIIGGGGIDSTLCSTVGIPHLSFGDGQGVSSFPNPFSNEIIISRESGVRSSETGEIILFDITGKEILRQNIFGDETKINTEKLLPGFYLLNYIDENRIANSKLLKF